MSKKKKPARAKKTAEEWREIGTVRVEDGGAILIGNAAKLPEEGVTVRVPFGEDVEYRTLRVLAKFVPCGNPDCDCTVIERVVIEL